MKKYMINNYMGIFLLAALIGFSQVGCSGQFWGGAATGAVGAGAAYEIQNKRQMDQLEEDYKKGNITREEYEARKKQIEKGSVFY
jgi:hypothetical protein